VRSIVKESGPYSLIVYFSWSDIGLSKININKIEIGIKNGYFIYKGDDIPISFDVRNKNEIEYNFKKAINIKHENNKIVTINLSMDFVINGKVKTELIKLFYDRLIYERKGNYLVEMLKDV
jgi:hypothetical protein